VERTLISAALPMPENSSALVAAVMMPDFMMALP
jgi:hypothetical protein